MKQFLMLLGMSLMACAGQAGGDLENKWCLVQLGERDTQLVMEAAQEWEYKTGIVKFSFVAAESKDDCGDLNPLYNIKEPSEPYSGRNLWHIFKPDMIEMNLSSFSHTDEFRDDNYRAVVMHEMGHYLLSPYFGLGWHSEVPGDLMYSVFPGVSKVWHLSDHDIANFRLAYNYRY